MRRKLLMLGLLLTVAMIGPIALWSFAPKKQKRYEDALLGKTLDEAKAILEGEPIGYYTRALEEKTGRQIEWPADEMAVGHWVIPISSDRRTGPVVDLRFDAAGKVIRVRYFSIVPGPFLSMLSQLVGLY